MSGMVWRIIHQGLGVRVQDRVFGVEGLEFRVQGLEFGASGLRVFRGSSLQAFG